MNLVNAKVAQFLADAPMATFVGGEWVRGSAPSISVIDPGTGRQLSTVSAASQTDVDQAVSSAQGAFLSDAWRGRAPSNRALYLFRLADLIERDAAIISEIESRDVGKPKYQASTFDIPHAAATFRYYANLAVATPRADSVAIEGGEAWSIRQPVGVCGFIFPWNFPFLLIAWGIAPALAAGNTVVIKPAEDTPLSTLYFAKLVEEAQFPPGVVNIIPGIGEITGAALAAHPGLGRLSFTGSTEVGRLVAEACGRNLVPVKLELGGKGAAIVFDDVNISATAQALSAAITLNTGQVCCTATRWLVQKDIWDDFIAAAKQALSDVSVGYGPEISSGMGPLVSDKQRRRVLSFVDRGIGEGAKALLLGGRLSPKNYENGFYVGASLLSGDPENICAREEIFGPVAFAMPFDTEAEAVSLTNFSRYGLANSIWSHDLSRARRVAEELIAGNSWINAHNVFPHGVTYGGCNLSGLGGGVLGPDALDDYVRKQSIVRSIQ